MPLSNPPRTADVARGVERWLGWCLGLGLLLLALAQLPSFFWQGEVVPKLIVLTIMVALLLLLLGLALLGPRGGALRISWYTLAGVAFVLWSGITAATGTSPRGSLLGMVFRYEGVLGFAAYLVVFLAARWLASSRFQPGRPFVVAGAAVVGLVGLLGLLQHVWPAGHPISSLSLDSFGRSQASFSNPTVLALFGCTVLPVFLVLVREESRSWLQTVLMLAASLIAAGAFLSYSRSFWLAAPIGCALALVLAGPPRRARWASAIPVVVLAGLFVVVAMQVGQAGPAAGGQAAGGVTLSGRVGETLSGGGSIRSRLELYRGALTLIAEKPVLGGGFETYIAEGARVRSERLVGIEGPFAYADRPHNSLLYIAYATGLPGLVLYLLFLGGAFMAAIRGYRSRSGPDKVLAAGLLGGLVAYVLAEQTLFSTIEVTPLFFGMLGWATASASVETPQGEGEQVDASSWVEGIRVPPQYVRVLAGLAMAAALGWVFVAFPHAVDVAAADRAHYRLASHPSDIERFEESARLELAAARRDPYTPYYWNTVALLLQAAADQFQQPAQLERAREVLEEGLIYLPNDPILMVSLSNVLVRLHRPSQAVALLVPYLAVDKYQTDAHFNLALAYLDLNQPREAAAHLETAVRFNPTDADSHWYLAKAYRALLRMAEAEREQETAASLNPEYRTTPDG